MQQYKQKNNFCTENSESWSVLERLAQEGARKILQQALEMEVEDYKQPKRFTSTVLPKYLCRMPSVGNGKLKSQ